MEAIGRVADLCVPALGDRCVVDLVDPGGSERRIADTAPGSPSDAGGGAWLRIPIVVRERRVGVLGLVGRELGGDDRLVADDLAHRMALALDAASAEATRRDLLASFSREVRTPLHVIMGYADLLHAGIPEAIPEPARRHAEQIRRAAKHLLWLLEQTLHASRRPDAMPETVHVGPADIGSVLRELAVLVEPLARARELTLSVQAPAERTIVFTDVGHLRRILYTLFEDVMGLTKAASVRVTARRDVAVVAIEVYVAGMAITAEWPPGGDAPVQRLADLIGAKLSVAASPDGATITVAVPLAWRSA